MELITTILTVYGISAIITISKIFEPLRDVAEKHSPQFWKYLTSCMQCLPFLGWNICGVCYWRTIKS